MSILPATSRSLSNLLDAVPAAPVVLVLGDSIAAGATSIREDTVVDRVPDPFSGPISAHVPGAQVIVDAVPLRRTPQLVALLPALLERHKPDVLFIATGANDADIDWRRFVISEGKIARSRTLPRQYEDALRTISALAAAAGASMVVSEVLGSSIELRCPYLSSLAGRDLWPWMLASGGQPRCDEMVADYRALTARAAAELGFTVARVGSALEAYPFAEVFAPDGTHPNALGYLVMGTVNAATAADALCAR